HLGHGEDHELGDLVAAADVDGILPVQVDGDHLDLTPVPRVDQAGRVHETEASPGGEAGAGLHEAGMAVRDGDSDARGDPAALAGRQDHVDRRAEVHAG